VVVVGAAGDADRGHGRKPDKEDKPRNPHAAARDKR
jgi:hypothetical protein